MSHIQRQRGMSIIEVMVAVTLAALLLTLGLPSFVGGMQNRQIRSGADAIQNGLTMARTEALRRNRAVKFHLADPTKTSWTVGCDPVDTSVQDGQQNCPALLQTFDSTEGSKNVTVAVQQLAQGTLTPVGTPVFVGDVTFTPLGRTTSATLPAGNVAEFLVSNPGAGNCVAAGGDMRCLSVRVTATGQIRMCDPAVTAAGDSRAC